MLRSFRYSYQIHIKPAEVRLSLRGEWYEDVTDGRIKAYTQSEIIADVMHNYRRISRDIMSIL